MKNLLLLLLSFLIVVPLYGQQKKLTTSEEQSALVVSSISGGLCYIQKGKKRTPLTLGVSLCGNDILVLETGSTMIAVEPKAVLRYTFKGAYTGSVRNYIKKNEQNCVKSISLKYVDYLLSQAFKGRKNKSGEHEDDEATVFRKAGLENDSIILSLKTIDSLYHTIDSLSPPAKK